jgi:regulator of extracellular matrix RemA (YlzA/DUF370 family)
VETEGMKELKNTLKIGLENIVFSKRIIAIVNPKSAPIKRLIKEAREDGKLIDGTGGKPNRAVVVMDSGHIVLSSVSPKKLGARMDKNYIE